MRRTLGISILVAATTLAPLAHGDQSVWTRARSPEAARRAELVAEADALIHRHERYRSALPGDTSSTDPMLREALRKLDEAGGPKSKDVNVLSRYGHVLSQVNDSAGCVSALEAAVKLPAPPTVLAKAWMDLAICHAKLGHQAQEIHGYDEALLLQSETRSRALLLANRAEALMAIGDLTGAVAGYREAQSLWPEMPTFYWGLAAALDRSGNLDGALEAIHLARSYDRIDKEIHSSDWFFSPPWDASWYFALGQWQAARTATMSSTRTEHYLAAVAQWEEYIQQAPAEDKYLPLARVRLKECEKERDRSKRRGDVVPPKKIGPSDVSKPPKKRP